MLRDDRISGLAPEEKALLAEALSALRRDRGAYWNAACDKAEAEGRRAPPLKDFQIPDINRLAKRLGVKALHWLET